MKNHDSGEGFGGINRCMAVAGLVDCLHDNSWVVADGLLVTKVLVGPVCAVSYDFSDLGEQWTN